jgi:hypothetical protein|nr:MAG TPA: Protein of unknown function (DUF1642) [Caudoviricetes sp.]
MNKQELIEKYKNKYPVISMDVKEFRYFIELWEDMKQLDEPQKPVVPQFVADWIEKCKNDDFHLFGAMEEMSLHQKKLDYWFREDDNMELFARAWLDGYEVEKEKRYLVKMKGVTDQTRTLKRNIDIETWYFGNPNNYEDVNAHHTRKELEEAGFGEVFNSPLFEVEEAE